MVRRKELSHQIYNEQARATIFNALIYMTCVENERIEMSEQMCTGVNLTL